MTSETVEKKCHNLMKFFGDGNLPEHLQNARVFREFAELLVALPDNEEKLMALRKLLEAKDCAIRACL